MELARLPLRRIGLRLAEGVDSTLLVLMIAAWLLPTERLLAGVSAGQKLPLVALAGGVATMLVGRFRPRRR